jgi:hypothetical protein
MSRLPEFQFFPSKFEFLDREILINVFFNLPQIWDYFTAFFIVTDFGFFFILHCIALVRSYFWLQMFLIQVEIMNEMLNLMEDVSRQKWHVSSAQ